MKESVALSTVLQGPEVRPLDTVYSELLTSSLWDEPLLQFSRSTGMVVTLYGANGAIISGPHTPNPLSQLYLRAGNWLPAGAGSIFEQALVVRALLAGAPVADSFASLLPMRAIPVSVGENTVGTFVVGWMFDHFADPLENDRLAKELGLSPLELWQQIRQHTPVPEQKLESYCELLATISTALVTEFLDRQNERRTSRILRMLNQSAQALTTANTIRDIAVAANDAALYLGANRARFYFSDENGIDLTKPFDLGSDHVDLAPLPTLSGATTRIPVQARDGQSLAVLEIEIDSSGELASPEVMAEFSALASQMAVAIQKVRLISDLQAKKATLELTLDELRRASTTRDEFLATVSHELRSPLNAMLGWCQILRMGGIDEAQREVALETIERNAHAQAKLIEDLLDISRIISGKMHIELTGVDVASVIFEAIKTVRPAAEVKKIKIEVHGVSGATVIKGDFIRLQQVFWNLLSNAVRHTPVGGRLAIEMKRYEDRVEISVSDSGEGISADFLPRLFDRFSQEDSTSKRMHGGLGLGLAIVQQIVQLHGGSIQAASRGPGFGSRFTVTLPSQISLSLEPVIETTSAHLNEASSGVAANRRPAVLLTGMKVLIVDDLEDSRQLMKVFVSAAGAHVRLADSAAAGLIEVVDFVPDVIISDIAMPGADGFEFIAQVRALADRKLALIPAIAVTAYSRDEDRQRCLASGFQDHVSKPVDSKKLIAAVHHLRSKSADEPVALH